MFAVSLNVLAMMRDLVIEIQVSMIVKYDLNLRYSPEPNTFKTSWIIVLELFFKWILVSQQKLRDLFISYLLFK